MYGANNLLVVPIRVIQRDIPDTMEWKKVFAMIGKVMEDEMNKQINEELYSGYLYLAIAADLEDKNLPGFANWMRVQAKEEQFHAMKFFDHLNERGGRVKLYKIEEPRFEWDSALAAFEAAYEHEQHVTGRINHMMDVAIRESDYATQSLLRWYVDEQVEEEDTALAYVEKLRMIGDHKGLLLQLDREMAARTFTPEDE